ncbi:hypothetical protein [Dactylosporangium cerinum]
MGSGLGDAVELDTKPPHSIDDADWHGDLSVDQISDGRFELHKPPFSPSTSFMVWDGGGTPELAQCQEAAAARGATQVPTVETGAVLCVRTTEGRAARLTVQKVDAKAASVTFNAVVWESA